MTQTTKAEKERVSITAGMRVRLLRDELWCAGRVPVGAEGTVYFWTSPNGHVMPAVSWDRIKPKEGSVFAIGTEIDAPLNQDLYEVIE